MFRGVSLLVQSSFYQVARVAMNFHAARVLAFARGYNRDERGSLGPPETELNDSLNISTVAL